LTALHALDDASPMRGEPSARETPSRCASCGGQSLERLYRLRPYDIYLCKRCMVRFRYPLPDERELGEMYDDPRYHESAYFKNANEAYSLSSPEIRLYRRALAGLAELVPPGRLLAAGCAKGVFLDLARSAGWDVSGVELSEGHAEYARTHFRVKVWTGDFLSAPLEPGSFDAITMWDFLEHVLDPPAVLARARTLLAPGGVLLIFTIDGASAFNAIGDVLYRVSAGRVQGPLELLYGARHNWFFTRASLTKLLGDQGFGVDRWYADRAYLRRWVS